MVNMADPMPPTPRSIEQLRVVLRQPGQSGRHRDDEDPGGQDHPLPEGVHQSPARQGGHESHQGERGDDCAGRGLADPERTGELRDRRRHHPEADRDRHRHGGQHRDLPREALERALHPRLTTLAGRLADQAVRQASAASEPAHEQVRADLEVNLRGLPATRNEHALGAFDRP